MNTDPFAAPAGKPLWLVTLVDLTLLMLGFVVLAQATGRVTLAQTQHERFGTPEPAALPVAAIAVAFASGSTTPIASAEAIDWVRVALLDPRMSITVTGAGDAGDPLQAADRAAAVVRMLAAAGLPAKRLQLATSRISGRRVVLTLAFAGETRSNL